MVPARLDHDQSDLGVERQVRVISDEAVTISTTLHYGGSIPSPPMLPGACPV